MTYLMYNFIECLSKQKFDYHVGKWKDMVFKNTASGVSKWKPLWGVFIAHLLRKIDAMLFFLNHHLTSVFLKHGCNETSTETCI